MIWWKKKIPAEETLLVRALKWASERGPGGGFTVGQLKEAIRADGDDWLWVQRFMLGEINNEPHLIAHLGSHHEGSGEYLYFLTASGAAMYMDYLELKEARAGARRATYWAAASLGLAAVVGVTQCLLPYVAPPKPYQMPTSLEASSTARS